MAELPKKWSRRIFAVYMITTIFGGVILFLFLFLLGLLYAMNVRVPLPDHHALLRENSDKPWLYVLAPGLDKLPPGTLQFLTAGAPSQVQRLLDVRNATRECPVQIVISAAPTSDGRRGETSLVASLGRYPGRFWLVGRDLEKRVQKQLLPLSLRRHDGKAIFVENDTSKPFGAFCLSACTLVRSSTADGAEALAGRLARASEVARQEGKAYPRYPEFSGMVTDWRDPPVEAMVPPASIKRWQDFCGKLLSNFPELAGIKSAEFRGSLPDPNHATLTLDSGTLRDVISQPLAEKLIEWLRRNGAEIGITSADLPGTLKDGAGVTVNVEF